MFLHSITYVCFCSAFLSSNPLQFFTFLSHSSKYGRNTSFNHCQRIAVSSFTYTNLSIPLTSNLKSSPLLFRCFLFLVPLVKFATFNRSKNLSKMATNFAISTASSPPVRLSALPTLSVRTYVSRSNVKIGKINRTRAARSTLIFAKEVKLMCSNFNFGTMASPVALPLSLSRWCHGIYVRTFHCSLY